MLAEEKPKDRVKVMDVEGQAAGGQQQQVPANSMPTNGQDP